MIDSTTDHPALRWLIVALTAVATVVVATAHRGEPLVAALLSVVVITLGGLSVIDIAQHRLPNRITYPLAGASCLVVLGAGLQTGEILRAVAAVGIGLAFAVTLLVLRFGLGDVKLSVSIGTIAGWLGWSAVATTMLVTAATGGLVGAVLMVVHRRRDVAFGYGPFLAIGAVAGMLAAAS